MTCSSTNIVMTNAENEIQINKMESNRFVCEFMCEVFLEIKKLPTLEFSKKKTILFPS